MNPSIAIIGTGFGGIAAAIESKRAGYDNLLLLEKVDAIGGVWRDNSYPGAACDVPSPLYSSHTSRTRTGTGATLRSLTFSLISTLSPTSTTSVDTCDSTARSPRARGATPT